jgi:hypothetical protein
LPTFVRPKSPICSLNDLGVLSIYLFFLYLALRFRLAPFLPRTFGSPQRARLHSKVSLARPDLRSGHHARSRDLTSLQELRNPSRKALTIALFSVNASVFHDAIMAFFLSFQCKCQVSQPVNGPARLIHGSLGR